MRDQEQCPINQCVVEKVLQGVCWKAEGSLGKGHPVSLVGCRIRGGLVADPRPLGQVTVELSGARNPELEGG